MIQKTAHQKLIIQLQYFTKAFLQNRGYFDAEYMTARAIQYLATMRDHDIMWEKQPVTGIGVYAPDTKIDTNYKIVISPTRIFAMDSNNNYINHTELKIN